MSTKGERTQARILETALQLIGTQGFANTSMQMIASACQLSQGAVMQHFPSKARLFEAIRKSVSQSNHSYVDAQVRHTDDGYIALKKHMFYNLEWALKNRAEADIIFLTYETGIHDAEYREVAAGAIRLGTERIYRYILAAQRERIVASDLDAEVLAQIAHEYLVGLILRALGGTKISRISKPIEARLDFFLQGLLKPSANK